ncbi:MAG: SUMF1/EgtB/PvdO family nonheme iron enzyme [Kofleriaceae bacterium]|nr:SUMF1/EgtB/PvdO family nonheme iron enzyme [Kofleriaceae bacterium]MCB9570593.1 SUMF1/EgtB/PvdO family nonheme iron enzyme [Kofleriaceae bacterium]
MSGARGTVAAVALALLVALPTGCRIDPFDLNGGDDTTGDDTTGDAGRRDGGGGGGDGGTCVATGLDDTCNEVDDDCNGVVDDPFDKDTDDANCGTCGNRCSAPNAVLDCQQGACVFVDCLPGFVDLDPQVAGCEYQCPVFPPHAEDCNGVDEDCDGMIDEAIDLPPPPQGLCRGTPGTPCEGTAMVCATRGAVTTWYCDYGPDVEFDPSIPNGILLQEQLCDGKDGDCDGVADDAFTDLGQVCDNGAAGVCRDLGLRTCDPGDPSRTVCDLTLPPDPIGPATAETCNGLDDDCNGVVDDAVGPGRVVDAMSPVTVGAATIYVDTYEASHPDATAALGGVLTHRACSNPGVLPWRGATYAAAAAACAAAGKRLCTADEWQAACDDGTGRAYPYGASFEAATCNAEPYDGIPGGNDDDVLLATGGLAACVSSAGPLDLSGNLKEWTDDITGQTASGTDIAVLRGGAYDTPALGATCTFRSSRAAVDTVLPSIGFRCCKDTAP